MHNAIMSKTLVYDSLSSKLEVYQERQIICILIIVELFYIIYYIISAPDLSLVILFVHVVEVPLDVDGRRPSRRSLWSQVCLYQMVSSL